MTMTFVRKFSEFVKQNVDQGVGLTGGANSIGPSSANGGTSNVSITFTQNSPVLAIGNWVRLNSSGQYIPAQGDTAQDAEVIGVITQSPLSGLPANTYVLQQSGYLPASLNVFNSGLGAPGQAWFLDTLTAGAMVDIDATVNNTVSRPVFVNDTDNSGWVLPYRGAIVGGVAPNQGGGGGGSNPDIVVVNQNGHGFAAGNWVRVSTPPDLVHNQPVYVLAQGDTLSDSQSVGVVISIQSANQFTMQFSGYNSGAVTIDEMGNPIEPAVVYYLSSTTPGALTSVDPGLTPGLISKPLFICEQTALGALSTGINTGWILPQRPLSSNSDNGGGNIHTVIQNNTFQPGQWLYISGDTSLPNAYQLAVGTTLATSQVAGVVIASSGTQFTVQQSGWIGGLVDGTYVDGGVILSGVVYYLSLTTPGNISPVVPNLNEISKPCYVQETLATNIGEILPQRPFLNTANTVNPNIVDVTQPNHGFAAGNWLYVSGYSGINPVYALGNANGLGTSEVVGVVLSATTNTFVLQTEGYNVGAVFQDDNFSAINQSATYYLSGTRPGYLTANAPTGVGQYTKPLYISEQTTATTGINAGFVLAQRPLPNLSSNTNPNIITITQNNHMLSVGQFVYISASVTYTPAYSGTFPTSQAVGVVINVINPNQFTIQTDGYNNTGGPNGSGAITFDEDGNVLQASGVYYLSVDVPGAITLTMPTDDTVFTKPVYISEQVFGTTGIDAGYILSQRPLSTADSPQPPVPVPGDVEYIPFSGTYGTTTTGWETVFCNTITPSSTMSNIWVKADIAAGAAGSGAPVYFRLIRNGTPIGVGDAAGTRLQVTGAVGHHFNGNPTNCFIDYIDSPSSIAPVTYCVQIISPSGAACYVNRTNVDTNNGLFGRSTSSIMLIEV